MLYDQNKNTLEVKELRRQINSGKCDQAIIKLNAIVASRPEDAYAWSTLAYAHNSHYAFENALDAINHALSLDPTESKYIYSKAEVLTNLKRYSQAIPLLESLLQKGFDEQPVLNRLCVAHFYLNNKEKAIYYGRRLLEAKDKYSTEHAKLRKLEVKNTQGKKIIAYSVWGNDKRYLVGAIVNAKICRTLLPDWTCRFYTDASLPAAVTAELVAAGAEIICDSPVQAGVPNYFWRFLVADDPEVQAFLCRDSDSRLTEQEASAIREWQESKKPFHLIRDHIIHTDLMLAGLWGGTPCVNFNMKQEILAYLKSAQNTLYGADQRFLGAVLWPLIKSCSLVHDNYYDLFNSKKLPEKSAPNRHIGEGITGEPLLKEEIERYHLRHVFPSLRA